MSRGLLRFFSSLAVRCCCSWPRSSILIHVSWLSVHWIYCTSQAPRETVSTIRLVAVIFRNRMLRPRFCAKRCCCDYYNQEGSSVGARGPMGWQSPATPPIQCVIPTMRTSSSIRPIFYKFEASDPPSTEGAAGASTSNTPDVLFTDPFWLAVLYVRYVCSYFFLFLSC